MNSQASKYLTAITVALQSDNEINSKENKEGQLNLAFTKNLATVLASFQVEKMESITSNEMFEEKVKQQEQYWVNYLEETKKQLNEAIKIFKTYDKKGLLTTFFQKIETRKNLSQCYLRKNFDILNQYAFEAFENKTWNDVYSMFLFITVYFPTEAKPYLFLSKATEETKGLDQASEFYKVICEILKDPDLYFFAAECELKLDHKDKAKEYLLKLKEVLGNSSSLSEKQQELISETDEILQALEQAA